MLTSNNYIQLDPSKHLLTSVRVEFSDSSEDPQNFENVSDVSYGETFFLIEVQEPGEIRRYRLPYAGVQSIREIWEPGDTRGPDDYPG